MQQALLDVIGHNAVERLHRHGAAFAASLALTGLGRARVVPVSSSLFPVRNVMALPQAAQKQMPVSSVGPLTMRGAVNAGLRVLSSVCTA